MRRRTLLTVLGGGTVAVAGCPSWTNAVGTDADPPREPNRRRAGRADRLPTECPTSQGLDVEWPGDLDAATVRSFVEVYEHAYNRDVVLEYEPESRLDEYGSSGVVEGPRSVGEGWVLAYSGSGGVYRPTLLVEATRAEPPAGADPIPARDVEDPPLERTLAEAAETGQAELHVDRPGEPVERYLARFESIAADFSLSGTGDTETLYVERDGTTVELTVRATTFHGDYWWGARYYVDERVVRRTTDGDTDPRNAGLECRRAD